MFVICSFSIASILPTNSGHWSQTEQKHSKLQMSFQSVRPNSNNVLASSVPTISSYTMEREVMVHAYFGYDLERILADRKESCCRNKIIHYTAYIYIFSLNAFCKHWNLKVNTPKVEQKKIAV